MNDFTVIPLFLTIAAFFIHKWYFAKFAQRVYPHYMVKNAGLVSSSIIEAGVLLAGYAAHFQQPAFYCLFFFLCLADFFFLPKLPDTGFLFWTNLRFILFAGFHIIFLAMVSAFNGRSVSETFRDSGAAALLCSMALLAASSVISYKWTPYEKIRILLYDFQRMRQLKYFFCYATVYILFDSLLCSFLLPYRILPWFITGSILLLGLEILMFIIHTYTIALNSHYETEYYRLKEEQALHIKKEMELKNLAYIDSLTGAFTRRYAMNLLNTMLKDGQCLSLAYIDLNGLKRVNDSLGHLEGDRYLLTVSAILNRHLRKNDVLARIGGDEFLIIAPDVSRFLIREWLEAAGKELEDKNDRGYSPSFSFGIEEVKTDSGYTAEELLRHTDNLMYENKKAFRSRRGGEEG